MRRLLLAVAFLTLPVLGWADPPRPLDDIRKTNFAIAYLDADFKNTRYLAAQIIEQEGRFQRYEIDYQVQNKLVRIQGSNGTPVESDDHSSEDVVLEEREETFQDLGPTQIKKIRHASNVWGANIRWEVRWTRQPDRFTKAPGHYLLIAESMTYDELEKVLVRVWIEPVVDYFPKKVDPYNHIP